MRENDRKDDIVAAFMGDESGAIWKAKITKKMKNRWLSIKGEGVKINWMPEFKTYGREDFVESIFKLF